LSGFTLTNGATAVTGYGGGVYCASANCTVTNCIMAGNSAFSLGGGAYSGTLVNCILSGNIVSSVGNGGGADMSTLTGCILTGNRSGYFGGGANGCTLINCTIVSNTAVSSPGGAMTYSTVKNCISYYNSPDNGGTGTYGSTFTSCCTIPLPSPGANNITNQPVFMNLAGGDYHLNPASPCINVGSNSFVAYSNDLDGNSRIVGGTVDIGTYEFQSPIHYVKLSNTMPVSPFTNWITAATNIQDAVDASVAGDFVVVSNGIYNYGGRAVYGSATNRVVLTNAITLLSSGGSQATMIVGGTTTRCVYVGSNSVLSGFTITNGHARTTGNLTNEESGGGIWCEPGGAAINCLVVSNYANFPGTYSGGYGGGIYGGAISNCTITANVAGSGGGVGGAAKLWNCTFIGNVANSGGGAYRAVLYSCTLSNNLATYNGNAGSGGGVSQCLASNCLLIGNVTDSSGQGGGAFQGTNFNCSILRDSANNGGGTYQSTNFNCVISSNTASIGGGAYLGLLYNCVLAGNAATNTISFYGNGGGANGSTLYNCTVTGNAATNDGGGVYNATLYNCTVSGNTASIGGGAYAASSGSLNNTIVYYNSSPSGSNWSGIKFNFCCTVPFTSGVTITNPPLFVDSVNGNYRLQAGSPCINAGSNIYVTNSTDLDGNPRVVGYAVDIGAYEKSPASILPNSWLAQYGFPNDGSADFADADGDAMNNYAEWKAGTIPTNAASLLQLESPAGNVSGVVVTWQSVNGVTYYLQRSSDLTATFSSIQSNIVGQTGMTSYNDTTATNPVPYFFRVGVQ
jgi:hypothetical protein